MLQKWAQRRSESAPPYIQIQTSNLHFEELADQLASSTLWARDPAVFAFIDPFGYKGISITSLRSLCSNPRSELLILFSFNAINRIANANVVDGTLERLFGTSQFAEAPQGDPKMRKEFLVQLYENQLRSVCRFQFISRFEMITPAGKSYFLLHCTRNPLGLEKFREVMWRVDPVSGNRFSAREGQQESLFGGEELIHLDRLILETYASKTASVADLESFVLHQTPYKKSHLRTHALRKLQSDDLVRPIGQKRKFAFPSDLKVRFAPFD